MGFVSYYAKESQKGRRILQCQCTVYHPDHDHTQTHTHTHTAGTDKHHHHHNFSFTSSTLQPNSKDWEPCEGAAPGNKGSYNESILIVWLGCWMCDVGCSCSRFSRTRSLWLGSPNEVYVSASSAYCPCTRTIESHEVVIHVVKKAHDCLCLILAGGNYFIREKCIHVVLQLVWIRVFFILCV